jgi:hypothetical protein
MGVNAPAFWLPLSIEPLINADSQWLHMRENQQDRLFGRLAPGFTIGQSRCANPDGSKQTAISP